MTLSSFVLTYSSMLSSFSKGSSPADCSHLPPEQRRKKLQTRINNINQEIQREKEQRWHKRTHTHTHSTFLCTSVYHSYVYYNHVSVYQKCSVEDEGGLWTESSDGRPQQCGAATGGSQAQSAETGGGATETPGTVYTVIHTHTAVHTVHTKHRQYNCIHLVLCLRSLPHDSGFVNNGRQCCC